MLNAKVRETGAEDLVEQSFLKALSLLEQAHRRLHDVVKDNLERNGERSLTGVQALLLYEIGESETPPRRCARAVRSPARRCPTT